MRNVIFLTGVTASGKTTTARKLGAFLGIPYTSTDLVYSALAEVTGFDNPPALVMPHNWKDIPNIGNIKKQLYKLLVMNFSGDFIVEGYNLFFEHDRVALNQAIGELFGDFWSTFFLLDIPPEKWLELAESKYGHNVGEGPYLDHGRRFEPPSHYYRVTDHQQLFIDYQVYQREGLTDKKWTRLSFDPRGKTILDLGCNDGWIGKYCLNGGAKRVVGVDRNWRYLEEARKKGIYTVLADLETYEASERFDTVLLLATLQHIENKERLLRNIAGHARELVLEMPIWKDGTGWLERDGYSYLTPSVDIVMEWLKPLFSKIKIVGESIPPDNSYRLILRATH